MIAVNQSELLRPTLPEIKKKLKAQLSHFGLNPEKWNLLSSSFTKNKEQLHIQLVHKNDISYRLKGIAQVSRLLQSEDKPYITFWQEIHSDLHL